MSEHVVHPKHYNAHPSKIECWDVVERLNFNLGNAVKYLWRAGLKDGSRTNDLLKAMQYLERMLEGRFEPWHRGEDLQLAGMAEILLHHGGWNSGIIYHLIVASRLRSPTHLRAAHNAMTHLINHPQEMRDAPQPRLS